MTGIDRVEYAYLRTLAARDDPFFALARTPLGYVLLDAEGARDMAQRLATGTFGPLDTIGRMAPDRPLIRREAEAALRRLGCARCLPQRLGAMLQQHLSRGTRYINTGHANLSKRMVRALRGLDARITVMVHDVIPLDAPEWQRPGTTERFLQFFRRVEDHADLVIYNSNDTRRRSEARMQRPPTALVAHLGVETALPSLLPHDIAPEPPFFVCLGTIEPRKNHALLLDLWSTWGSDAPSLILAGRRGWQNEEVFARLDRGVPGVIEAPGLTDGQVTTLLETSHGLLFPSHLEGYGLPPMEAAALGVPVVAQPLAVLKEVMAEIPIYADAADPVAWRAAIADLAASRHNPPRFDPPTWASHFNAVLSLT